MLIKSFNLGKWIPFGLVLLNTLFILPYPMLWMPMVMANGGPGANKDPFLALLNIAILIYPFPIIYTVVIVWQKRKIFRSIDMWKMYAVSHSGLLLLVLTTLIYFS